MRTATIYFSDKSTLVLSERDVIIPIIGNTSSDGNFASMSVPVELYWHTHDGLIPSIMDALCFCSFFCVKSNDSPAYCVNSIIKIENN